MNKLNVLYSNAPAISSFEIASSHQNLQECIEALIRISRINHFVLCINTEAYNNENRRIYWTTLPAQWIIRYNRLSYILHDPVAKAGLSEIDPFFWSDLKLNSKGKIVLDDASQHGVGPCGYCIPMMIDGIRFFISVSSRDLKQTDWQYYIESIYPELCQFSENIYIRAINELKSENIFYAE